MTQLELWPPATVSRERHYLSRLEREAARIGRAIDRYARARDRENGAVQILSPLLCEVERACERRPGEPGWARAEAGA